MTLSKCHQLALLMWKIGKLQIRKPFMTVSEIVIPLGLLVIVILIRGYIPVRKHNTVVYRAIAPSYQEYAPSELLDSQIFYAPNVTDVNEVMTRMGGVLQMKADLQSDQANGTVEIIRGYPTERLMLRAIKSNRHPVAAAVVFTNIKGQTLPKHVKYKIRPSSRGKNWLTAFKFALSPVAAQGEIPSGEYQPRFLGIQLVLGLSIIDQQAKPLQSPLNMTRLYALKTITLSRIPYPPHISDIYGNDVLPIVVVVLFLISYVLVVMDIIKSIVYERRLLEAMKCMGLDTTVYWMSWFILYAAYFLVLLTIIAVLYTVQFKDDSAGLFHKSSWSLILVMLLLYGMSIMTYAFMVTVFFTTAAKASMVGIVLYFVILTPSFLISPSPIYSRGIKMTASLSANTAIYLGISMVFIYEQMGDGAQWTNFITPPLLEGNTSLADVMLMLFLDSCIHLTIMWYVSNVRPGEFDLPRPWNFPFTKTYWRGEDNSIGTDVRPTTHRIHKSSFETEPNLKVGIATINLRKKYSGGSKALAVVDMTLNMYEGQITALLGQNGAGKTTAMSMITGFLPPTSGTALVNGHDITTDISVVHQSLGICPQHDILFDNLTVEEHLGFYAELTGVPRCDLNRVVDTMMENIDLTAKRNVRAKSLSGGQRRKLSVGIALCGNSKVVVLDEPSSGMDPQSRRELWDILVRMKSGRTILMSTHSMDEADLLGDRIAIMAEGVVKCFGSPLFLKAKYGTGYNLAIAKGESCNEIQVTAMVKNIVPTVQLRSHVAAELKYTLHGDDRPHFKTIFALLEREKASLGISSYGLSETTMEDVFLQIGQTSEETKSDTLAHSVSPTNASPAVTDTQNVSVKVVSRPHRYSQSSKLHISSIRSSDQAYMEYTNDENVNLERNNNSTITDISAPLSNDITELSKTPYMYKVESAVVLNKIEFNLNLRKNTGIWLKLQQLRALLTKKVIHSVRNWSVSLFKVLLPLLFATLALIGRNLDKQSVEDPAVVLNLNQYPLSYIPVAVDSDTINIDIATLYRQQFTDTKAKLVHGSEWNFTRDYFLKEATTKNLIYYKSRYFIGAAFYDGFDIYDKQVRFLNGYYSGEGIHLPAISLGYLINSLCQATLGKTYSIETTNEPLPKNIHAHAKDTHPLGGLKEMLVVTLIMMLGIMLVSASYVVFIINERITRATLVQLSSGVPVWIYWLANFTWDFITFLIPCALMLIVLHVFRIKAYLGANLSVVFLLFVLYGWASIPFTYFIQFPFKTSAGGMIFVVMFVLVTGITGLLLHTVLIYVADYRDDLKSLSAAITWILTTTSPSFCLGKAVYSIYENYVYLEICGNFDISSCEVQSHVCCNGNGNCGYPEKGRGCLPFQHNYLSVFPSGVGMYLIGMFTQGLLFMTLTILIDMGMLLKIPEFCCPANDHDCGNINYDDVDVKEESERISNNIETVTRQNPLVIDKLYKRFGLFTAVNHVSVAVPKGECFGLLGVNGAGKTTSFRMLTGDVRITGGDAFVNRRNVRSRLSKHGDIGYCPQYDAHIDQMTGREMLYLYAGLRGIHNAEIPRVVENLEIKLMLTAHANEQTSSYSRGTKRKLSTAIALIGDPSIVFLDEPTTGMDPAARRKLWNVLSDVRSSGRTLVFTSHSMEECDVLCTRIAIMVNGRFRCLGSPQHLKSKFGKGYTLAVRVTCPLDMSTPDLRPVEAIIEQSFPSHRLLSAARCHVSYSLTEPLHHIFDVMESIRYQYGIEDYSVSQTTLDHIFVEFARGQRSNDMEKVGCCSRCWAACSSCSCMN